MTTCRDVLSLCDGYNCAFGNDCAYCCVLEAGYEGPHRDELEHEGKSIVITWDTDDDSPLRTDDEHPPLAC
jgi:hypothetical protein